MSAMIQPPFRQLVPVAARTPSVVMGKTNGVSVLLRLIGMELYKIRRYRLAKVLLSVAMAIIVGAFFLVSVSVVMQRNTPASNDAPARCSQTSPLKAPVKAPACLDHQPSQAELAHDKQKAIDIASDALRLPTSFSLISAIAVTMSILTSLIIILAGGMAGGEYSLGTVRLMFTRGPTRIQFLLAKVLTALICAAIGLLTITLMGILLGYILNFIVGSAPDFHFFTAAWLGQTLLTLLIGIVGWFTYAVIAIFFGIFGRSTAAGIVGGLLWLFIEPILSGILSVASFIGSPAGTFLRPIPDYFISNNINTLMQNPTNSMHSILVITGYLIVFIGLSCWLTVRRDVTQ